MGVFVSQAVGKREDARRQAEEAAFFKLVRFSLFFKKSKKSILATKLRGGSDFTSSKVKWPGDFRVGSVEYPRCETTGTNSAKAKGA